MQNKDERIRERIDYIRKLEAGWLDGIGVEFDRDGLDWLCEAVCGMTDDYGVGLYPTPEGKVEAEWDFGPWCPSVEIDIVAKTGWLHDYNLDTQQAECDDLDLGEPETWVWLADKLEGYAESQAKEM